MNQRIRINWLMMFVFLILGSVLITGLIRSGRSASTKETNYAVFLEALNGGKIEKVTVDQSESVPSGTVSYTLAGDKLLYYFFTPDVNTVQTDLLNY